MTILHFYVISRVFGFNLQIYFCGRETELEKVIFSVVLYFTIFSVVLVMSIILYRLYFSIYFTYLMFVF